MGLVAACVWRISDDLIAHLAERLGEPTDSYVNGSQTWLVENGPRDEMLEWRLHPVAGFRRPPALDTFDIWPAAVEGSGPPVAEFWDGLEAFPAYTANVEPGELRAAVVDALGLAPDAIGLVDHGTIGDEWERTQGRLSVVDALLAQMGR